MEFIKRHYEKLMLAGLLVLFIGSMIYLVQIMRETGSISQEALKIPTRAPDFKRCDEKAPEFDVGKQLFGIAPWTASAARPGSRYPKLYSDLVVTFGAARCGHCERIIPLFFFGDPKNPCPWCRKALEPPPKQVVFRTGVVTAEDPDGCGIPHRIKEQYGLSTSDPANVLDDLDNDGFSNLYEYKQQTRLDQPKSHPPMWHRLVVVKIERIKLPLQLKAIMVQNPKDKAQWDIQINMLDKQRTEFTMLNERLKIDEVPYRIKDITLDKSEKDSGGNPIDKSYIDLESDKGVKIRMQIGKDVFTPDAKAVLKDLGSGQEYTLGVGQEFRIGTRKTGISRFVIKSVDQQKKEVILQFNSGRDKGKPVPEPITRNGKIPENERVREQSFQNRTEDVPGGIL